MKQTKILKSITIVTILSAMLMACGSKKNIKTTTQPPVVQNDVEFYNWSSDMLYHEGKRSQDDANYMYKYLCTYDKKNTPQVQEAITIQPTNPSQDFCTSLIHSASMRVSKDLNAENKVAFSIIFDFDTNDGKKSYTMPVSVSGKNIIQTKKNTKVPYFIGTEYTDLTTSGPQQVSGTFLWFLPYTITTYGTQTTQQIVDDIEQPNCDSQYLVIESDSSKFEEATAAMNVKAKIVCQYSETQEVERAFNKNSLHKAVKKITFEEYIWDGKLDFTKD